MTNLSTLSYNLLLDAATERGTRTGRRGEKGLTRKGLVELRTLAGVSRLHATEAGLSVIGERVRARYDAAAPAVEETEEETAQAVLDILGAGGF